MAKKNYIILLIFLLIILTATPLVVGILFKKNFFHVISIINADKRLKLEVLSYHEGWFTSKATIRLTLLNKDQTPATQLNIPELKLVIPVSFILEENINHGPIIYSQKLETFAFGYAYLYNNLYIEEGKKYLFDVDVLAKFNNLWQGKYDTALLEFALPTFDKITIAGLEGRFSFQLDKNKLRHVQNNIQTGAIVAQGNNQGAIKTLSIEPVKIMYNLVHELKGLWSGRASLLTSRIILIMQNQASFIINNVLINNTFSFNEFIVYSTHFAIHANYITSPNYSLPAFSQLQILISGSTIRTKGLDDYIHAMKSKSPAEIKNIDLKKIEDLLAQTVDPMSKLTINVSANTSLGFFSLHSQSGWRINVPLPQTLDAVYNNSFTNIKLKLSRGLVIHLLSIYGDEIMANTKEEIAKYAEKSKVMQKIYFKNQLTEEFTPFTVEVTHLLNQNLISTAIYLQLLDFQRQHLSRNLIFTNLNQLNLSPEIKAELMHTYPEQIAYGQSVDNKIEKMIQDLLAISYLHKDSNDYLSELVIENGILKINGNPLIPGK